MRMRLFKSSSHKRIPGETGGPEVNESVGLEGSRLLHGF